MRAGLMALAGASFEDFVSKYAKVYDHAEAMMRHATYDANMLFIEEWNKNKHDVVLGENEFTDMTWAEFKAARLTGWKDMPQATASLGEHEIVGDAPASVDWTAKGMVSAVKNQEQCGSCWAFSTTGSMESRYKIATGKTVLLSEQQFVDCAGAEGNNGCSGGLPVNAFAYAEKTPICTEEEYGYIAKDETCKGTTNCDGVAAGKLTGFKTVANSVDALADAVAQGPVSVAIEADKAIFQHYKSGVLSGSCGGSIDHAVLVTGYGVEDGQAYWRVKNSWGATWGDAGYINLAKGKSGFFHSTGECGIRSHAAYPIFGSSEEIVV